MDAVASWVSSFITTVIEMALGIVCAGVAVVLVERLCERYPRLSSVRGVLEQLLSWRRPGRTTSHHPHADAESMVRRWTRWRR